MTKLNYIPEGPYCYNADGVCPHWTLDLTQPPQMNGYCSFIKRGDWMGDGVSLLFDQCKECQVNWGDEDGIECGITEAELPIIELEDNEDNDQ